jgi:hypothetical protein
VSNSPLFMRVLYIMGSLISEPQHQQVLGGRLPEDTVLHTSGPKAGPNARCGRPYPRSECVVTVPRSRDRLGGVGPDEAALGAGVRVLACMGCANTMQRHKQTLPACKGLIPIRRTCLWPQTGGGEAPS